MRKVQEVVGILKRWKLGISMFSNDVKIVILYRKCANRMRNLKLVGFLVVWTFYAILRAGGGVVCSLVCFLVFWTICAIWGDFGFVEFVKLVLNLQIIWFSSILNSVRYCGGGVKYVKLMKKYGNSLGKCKNCGEIASWFVLCFLFENYWKVMYL